MTEELKDETKEEKAIELKKPGFIANIQDLNNVASIMLKSGLFKDIQDVAQASVKIMAGQELGLGPFASMKNVYIISGQATLSSGLMASKVKAHPKYDYRIKHLDDDGCIISFYEKDDKGELVHLGDSSFDKNDAQVAGLDFKDNWKKYGRNMYFSRAMSNGVRWYCPDVFYGMSVYTPDEIDPAWAIEGEISVEVEDLKDKKKPDGNNLKPTEKPELKTTVERPMTPEILADKIAKKADQYRKANYKITEDERKKFVIDMAKLSLNNEDMRHATQLFLFGHESSKDIDDANLKAGLDWMNFWQDEETKNWLPGQYVVKEFNAVIEHVSGEIKENGDSNI
jgi:hypothetical protein